MNLVVKGQFKAKTWLWPWKQRRRFQASPVRSLRLTIPTLTLQFASESSFETLTSVRSRAPRPKALVNIWPVPTLTYSTLDTHSEYHSIKLQNQSTLATKDLCLNNLKIGFNGPLKTNVRRCIYLYVFKERAFS